MKPAVTVARSERRAQGKALREKFSRAAHAEWKPRSKSQDVIKLLEESDADRIPILIPVKYQRMAVSPFTFFRGAAIIQARDLANAPVSGITVQACGDCHLANFGGFASPERVLVFDINDFDETFPGPLLRQRSLCKFLADGGPTGSYAKVISGLAVLFFRPHCWRRHVNKANQTLKQRAVHEMRAYLVRSFYLFAVFSLFVVYKSVILAEHHINFALHGIALFNALALAKVMLLAQDLHFADQLRDAWPARSFVPGRLLV